MGELMPVLTVLGSDPYDERDGLRASPEDLSSLKSLSKGTKLYAIPDTHRVVSVEFLTQISEWLQPELVVATELRAIIDNKGEI